LAVMLHLQQILRVFHFGFIQRESLTGATGIARDNHELYTVVARATQVPHLYTFSATCGHL